MAEDWRAIVGWEGIYEVSSLARVRRLKSGRIMTRFPDNNGRYRVKLRSNGRRADARTYVLVAAAFLGPTPKGYEVNHKDHDKTNDVLSNLEFMTRGDNMRHSYQHGRWRPTGEKHGRAVLSDLDVRDAISRVGKGESRAAVARRYKVSPTHIGRIVAGKSRDHAIKRGGVPSQI